MTQLALSPPMPNAIERLRGGAVHLWPNIAAAEALSQTKTTLLSEIAADLPQTDEGALVVFGSLARREFTDGSDLDWAIMIDGRADSGHLEIVHALKQRLEEKGFGKPGPTEVFGGLVFSHELIHAIGGDEDTNRNMTRRLLLLLESEPIDAKHSREVYDRVMKGILNRYVREDASFIAGKNRSGRLPRFLLNDVVRFWRTMAVDYANKHRARAGQKWALRNIKLRMSRKLLFVSGMFMCFSWMLSQPPTDSEAFLEQRLVSHLNNWTRRTPLESLATVVERYAPHLVSRIFDPYDKFIGILSDEESRRTLEGLSIADAYQTACSPLLGRRRRISIWP